MNVRWQFWMKFIQEKDIFGNIIYKSFKVKIIL